MPIRFRCPACRTVAEVPDGYAGNRTACPSCALPLRVPEAPEAPARQEAIRVQVSARTLNWPQKCACCGGPANTTLRLRQTRFAGPQGEPHREGYWEAPYCTDCLAHLRRAPGSVRKPDCCAAGPAVFYDGAEVRVHTFRFLSPAYAGRFIEANAERCLGTLRSDPAARKPLRG
jgi:hypothetical protein